MNPRRVVIAGGSGQVGAVLARAMSAQGDDVTILSRGNANGPWRTLLWDGRTAGAWSKAVDGADVVINLAGRNVNCRYHEANRRAIMDSRVDSTRAIGNAIGTAANPPRVWLQASTATIYAHRFDAPNDEVSGIIGGAEPGAPEKWAFSITVAKAWEETCVRAATPGTRKVLMRSAMVMSPDCGGIFDTLLTLVRRGLGGVSGNGRQYVSWVHERDFAHAVQWLIAHDELSGAVNIASPNPLPNAEFMSDLRQAAGVRFGMPAPAPLLEIGAALMGTETELLLKSRRVVPRRLLEDGFSFEFPRWREAAVDLVQRSGG